MKAKSKTPARIKINTGLFVLAAIIFGVMTFCGAQKIQTFSNNFIHITDAPGLCHSENTHEDFHAIENAYPCSSLSDEDGNFLPATSQNDYAMFLYDHTSFSSTILAYQITIATITIGSILTAATLLTAIIYYNHNRK